MHRPRAVVVAMLAGSIVPVAHAQTSWTNPAGGLWNVVANWSNLPPNVGIDGTIALAGVYNVTSSANSNAANLTISNPTATLNINSGTVMQLFGNLANASTVVVNTNSGSANAALVMGAASNTISGAGTIVLNAVSSINDANIDTTAPTNVFTHSAGHTITGHGQIFAGMFNQGLIKADGAGKYIQLSTHPKPNTGLIVSLNGATVDLEGVAVDQTGGGIIRADGVGSIAQVHGSVTSGTIEAINGGVARTGGVLTLDAVALNGPFEVTSGATANVLTSLVNTGTITVNPSGGISDANISFNSPTLTLSGGGTIALNGVSSVLDANLNSGAPGNVVTQAAGNTITGNGRIGTNMTNNGLIRADGAGKTILMDTNPKTNNALILAQNGGVVDINGVAIAQGPAGQVRADGAGSIAEVHGGLTGGTLEGINGGVARTGGVLILDAVTLNGAVEVTSNTTANVLTSLVNTGTITVNPSGGISDGNLSFNSPALTVSGGGTIILNAVSSVLDANLNSGAPANVMTLAAGNTITGNGRIGTNMINSGLVKADGAGDSILLDTNPKTNNALILAQNGGMVDISGVTVTQGAAGVVRADGAGSIAEASGGLTGGAFEGINGGIARTGGALALTDVDTAGQLQVISGHTVSVLGSLTNGGTITVNPTGGAANAVISFNSPALTLDGAGTIMLNGVGSTNDANLAAAPATNVLTHGPAHTIAGNGQVLLPTINQGTLTPGHPAPGDQTQTLEFGAACDLTCAASSTIRIDVEGAAAGQFDTITGGTGTDIVCAGALEVTHINGYTGPVSGTFLDIIVAGSGSTVTGAFSSVVLPGLPDGARYYVVYAPDRVRLYVACFANCDGSTTAPVLNVADFTCYLQQFAAGASYANCDGSTTPPVLNVADFTCFLQRFAAGCN